MHRPRHRLPGRGVPDGRSATSTWPTRRRSTRSNGSRRARRRRSISSSSTKMAPILADHGATQPAGDLQAVFATCGSPTTGDVCAFCRLQERVAGHEPVPVELVLHGKARKAYLAAQAATEGEPDEAVGRGRPCDAARRQEASVPVEPRRGRRVPHPRRLRAARRHHRPAREGAVVRSTKGAEYTVLRPTLEDYVLEMPRGAQVIYPKDLATICMLADIGPGMRVFETGIGSGAMSMTMLRYGVRHRRLRGARRLRQPSGQANVREFLGEGVLDRYDVHIADSYEGIDAGTRPVRSCGARPARAVAGRSRTSSPCWHPVGSVWPTRPRSCRPSRFVQALDRAVDRRPHDRGAPSRMAHQGSGGAARPSHGGAHGVPHRGPRFLGQGTPGPCVRTRRSNASAAERATARRRYAGPKADD